MQYLDKQLAYKIKLKYKDMNTYQNKIPIVKGCLSAMAIQITIVATILLLVNWIK